MSEAALVWLVMGPLLGAVLAYVAGPRIGGVVSPLVAVSVAAAAVVAGMTVWEAEAPLRYAIGGWPAPLGIAMWLDGLSAFFVLMTAAVGLAVSVYALGYLPPVPTEHDWPTAGRRRGRKRWGGGEGWSERESFWPLWLVLWGAMNAVLLSADLFNIYVALEVMSLAAVALVTLTGETAALTAAMRYLLATLLGSAVYLLGVVLVYALAGVLDLHLLTGELESSLVLQVAMGMMIAGLLIKTAVFPMHFWLPGAHANAPAPVSAVLSAVVVKVTLYLVIRLWFGPMEPAATIGGAQVLGMLGAAAVVWGSVQALRQRRLKLLIAYSTVAQLGYMMLIVPLTMGFNAAPQPAAAGQTGTLNFDAWSGGFYHVLSHALAKASMFMVAGAIMVQIGHDRIVGMRGVVSRMPLTAFTFGLAAINLIGLPPSSGFVAKWFMLNAAIATGQWWWGVVLLLGGLFAAMYVFRVFIHAFLPAPRERVFTEASAWMTLPALVLAVTALLLGLRASEPFALLEMAAPFTPEAVEAPADAGGGVAR